MLTIRQYKLMTASLLLMLAVFALSGCNTVEGVGRDLRDVGQAIDDAF